MATTTTNFGWDIPQSTDLVKDGATAIATLGQDIDTSMVDLKGGTTGQILSKTSNTDMDFTWINNDQGDITGVTAGTGLTGGGTSGAVTLTNDMATTITTNGDLIYGTGAGTYTRRGIGTTGQILTVSGGVPTWATPAGGGKVLQVVNATTSTQATNTSTTYADTGLSASITPSASTSKVLVLVSHNGCIKQDANIGFMMKLLRGATLISQMTSLAGYTNSTLQLYFNSVTACYLDSPATTSSTTYKTQFAASGAGGTVKVQDGNNHMSMITLLEIGA